MKQLKVEPWNFLQSFCWPFWLAKSHGQRSRSFRNGICLAAEVSRLQEQSYPLREWPWLLFFYYKDAGLHSNTLLQHCAKDQTQILIFNKDIKFTAFETPMSCSGLQWRKKSYSRFPWPTKLKDERNLLQNIYFLSVQLESRF